MINRNEKECIVLVGPQGSGKTTLARSLVDKYKDIGALRISQDDMGKINHFKEFEAAIDDDVPLIVVDRCNFDKAQRKRYLNLAKLNKYTTTIIDITSDPKTCFENLKNRENHPTIKTKNEQVLLRLLYNFYKSYEKPELDEADNINDLTTFNPRLLDLTDKFYNKSTNQYKPYMIIGDIHGCYDEMLDVLMKGGSIDRSVIAVGDLVDKGPKVFEVIKHFMHRKEYYCVMGNHEDKLLRHLIGNNVKISGGMSKTLDQWQHDWNRYITKTDLALYFLSLPDMIKIGSNFIFHAGIHPLRDMYDQPRDFLLRARKYDIDTKWHGTNKKLRPWYEYVTDRDARFRYSRRFFGHQYVKDVSAGYNSYALDGHCVHGKELRAVKMPERKVITVPAKKVYYPDKCSESEIDDKLMPFEEHVESGHLRKVEQGDLVLYTYTQKCIAEKEWNIITKQARGIIFNKVTGEIVARPFPKFFNLGEMKESEYMSLPDEPYTVYEKLDGSMGTVYYHDGKWNVATKGSFTSDQAKKATELLKKYNLTRVPKGWTLVVEIIYPENRFSTGARLVVDYGKNECLRLLAIINKDTRQDFGPSMLKRIAKHTGLTLPGTYSMTIDELIDAKKDIPPNMEGWVVRFNLGFRVKIKGDAYCRASRLINEATPLAFWEEMNEGKIDRKIIDMLPKDFRDDADILAQRLESRYVKCLDDIELEIKEMIKSGAADGHYDDPEFRKAVGLYIKKNNPEHGGAFFPKLYGREKSVDKYIMRKIKPKGNVL